MPQVTLKFADENAIPAELKAFKQADNSVTVWAGDTVAAETNPGLAANRDQLKTEKEAAVKALADEKAQWTQTNDTLSREVIDLRTKVATTSGVTAEEVALLNAVKPFGTDPAKIKTTLEDATKAAAENATLKREILVKDVAQIMGWKPTVLLDLINHPEKSKDIELVIEDATENDKPVKKVFVNQKDAAGAVSKIALTDFVTKTESWNDYLPILSLDEKNRPQWMRQAKPTDTKTGDDDIVAKHIEQKNTAAKSVNNPLLPATAHPPAPAA